WGELMSTIAKRNGATGCICDSMIRDCRKIMAMEFPVFYGGIRPLDSMGRGRVMAYDVPVRCGDVLVHPHELIFSDFDGIVVIPKGLEDEVLWQAYEKVNKENQSRIDLLNGDSLRTVFDRYGVL
ncbi:MAG: RraA family protein, partial [Rhodospirillales bacterium]|nr:RraA family protein [Acetobacter sp.]